ncbi:zinc ABC transporter substrate-binding protein [Streptomyces sp. CC208A]|uniref:metal ABC transporter solute-binding protein, Zn/Mn family n=1 Tax=Streptomyces sp. CC208A TaxID=3044573 RepID=UPI0024A7C29A|nr:zinc ABC transporter substrate-binding protein [Streptomyces sp. CC208A]
MRGVSRRLPNVLLGASLALTGAWVGPADAASARVPVVASTNVYGDVVEQVGGERVSVVSVISDPAQDPHSYEASTRTQLELSRAEVVVENGGGYDDFVGRMLRSSDNSSAQVISAVEVSGKEPDDGGEFNEHVWYDLPTMGRLADRIAQALGRASPADADVFKKNAEDFKKELAGLEARTDRIKARDAGTPVAVTEPVPLYLTEACGLTNRTPAAFSEAVEEGDEVSPRVLRETLALFAGRQVRALVHNEQTSGPQTEQVKEAAEDNGIPVVPVTETLPQGKDYVGWMADNITALDRALDR